MSLWRIPSKLPAPACPPFCFRRLVPYQTSKGPTGETHVRVDDHTRYPFFCRMGVNRRRMFPPRINLFADSGMSAPRHISRLADNADPLFPVSSRVGAYKGRF